ncbi:MAG: hypothetical protein V3S37_05325, partial [Dehalococcoidia bacterium]
GESPERPSAWPAALRETVSLRSEVEVLQLDVDARSLKECLLYARELSIGRVVTVDEQGKVRRSNVPGP